MYADLHRVVAGEHQRDLAASAVRVRLAQLATCCRESVLSRLRARPAACC